MTGRLYACCPMHSTIAGGKVGGKCPYCKTTLYLSDSLGAKLKVNPFDFSRLPSYRDPMFDFVPDAKVFVELGTQRGFTAHRAAIHLPQATIHCIDPWENYAGIPEYVGDMKLCWEIFRELHKGNMASGHVVAHKGFSWDIAPDFHKSIDVLWIDGDHTYAGVLRDLTLWVPKVRPGGFVVGDNYETSDVKNAVDAWASWNGVRLTIGHALGKRTKNRRQFWFKKEE